VTLVSYPNGVQAAARHVAAKKPAVRHVLVTGLWLLELIRLADDVADQNGQFTRALADQIS
jgi:hypothetical protein